MAKGTRKCKICGKEYEYCRTETNNKFRWQDVACCPEHATEYFELIAASREKSEPAKKSKKKKATREVAKKEVVVTEQKDTNEEVVSDVFIAEEHHDANEPFGF